MKAATSSITQRVTATDTGSGSSSVASMMRTSSAAQMVRLPSATTTGASNALPANSGYPSGTTSLRIKKPLTGSKLDAAHAPTWHGISPSTNWNLPTLPALCRAKATNAQYVTQTSAGDTSLTTTTPAALALGLAAAASEASCATGATLDLARSRTRLKLCAKQLDTSTSTNKHSVEKPNGLDESRGHFHIQKRERA